MSKTKKPFKALDFDDYLKEELKNPKFKSLFDEYGRQLEISYQILQLRKKRGLSQLDLAKKIGTNQSNVARIESGQQNCTIKLLDRIANALEVELKVSLG